MPFLERRQHSAATCMCGVSAGADSRRHPGDLRCLPNALGGLRSGLWTGRLPPSVVESNRVFGLREEQPTQQQRAGEVGDGRQREARCRSGAGRGPVRAAPGQRGPGRWRAGAVRGGARR